MPKQSIENYVPEALRPWHERSGEAGGARGAVVVGARGANGGAYVPRVPWKHAGSRCHDQEQATTR